MRLRATTGSAPGWEGNGKVIVDSDGDTVLVVLEEPWCPGDCKENGVVVLSATAEEIAALERAGYELPVRQ